MDEEFVDEEEITFELVLMDSAPFPYTFEAFHQYLEKKVIVDLNRQGSEEKADFLAECILYQRIAAPYFPDPISFAENTVQILENKNNIPFPTILEDMTQEAFQSEIQFVNDAWAALTEKFIMAGAPCPIKLPADVMEALQELVDAGYSHPDILAESYGIIAEMLSDNEFENFLTEQRKLADSIAVSQNISQENLQIMDSNPSSTAGSTDIISDGQKVTKNGTYVLMQAAKNSGLKSFAKGILSGSREMLNGSSKSSLAKKKQSKSSDTQLYHSTASLESGEAESEPKLKSKSKSISKLIASTAKRPSTLMAKLPKLDRESCHNSSSPSGSSRSRFPIPFIKTKSFKESETTSNSSSKSLTQMETKIPAAVLNMPLPDVTFVQVMAAESIAPYSYHEYHLFLSKLKCEENLEFLVDCNLYQRAANVFFPTPIQPSDFLERLVPTLPQSVTEEEMEFECEALWGWMTEIAWKYLRPGAPREINVPSKIRRLLVGLIDKKVLHPGILTQCKISVEEFLSRKEFFDRFLYDRLESTLPEAVRESQTEPALKKKMSIRAVSRSATQTITSGLQLLRNGSVRRQSESGPSDNQSSKDRFSVSDGIILEASDESGKVQMMRKDSTASAGIISETSQAILQSEINEEEEEDAASPLGKPTLQERLAKMQQVMYKKAIGKSSTKLNDSEPISPVMEQPLEEAKSAEKVKPESTLASSAQRAANRISMLLGKKDEPVLSEAPGTESNTNKKSASSRVKSFFGGKTTSKQDQ